MSPGGDGTGQGGRGPSSPPPVPVPVPGPPPGSRGLPSAPRGQGHRLRARGAPRSPETGLVGCSSSFPAFPRTSEHRQTGGSPSRLPPPPFSPFLPGNKTKQNKIKPNETMLTVISEGAEIKAAQTKSRHRPVLFSPKMSWACFERRQAERSVVKHLRNSALRLRKSVSLYFVSVVERNEVSHRFRGGGGWEGGRGTETARIRFTLSLFPRHRELLDLVESFQKYT